MAAGESLRMPEGNKLLRDWAGEPLIRRVARIALSSQLDSLIAVLGYEADQVRQALDGLGIEFVLSPLYSQGMGSSLSAGIERVRDRADAVVILLGDMPRIRSGTIDKVLANWRKGGFSVVHCGSQGAPHPPTLFDRELFDDLAALTGDHGAKLVIESQHGRACALNIELSELTDLNESSDWQDAQAP